MLLCADHIHRKVVKGRALALTLASLRKRLNNITEENEYGMLATRNPSQTILKGSLDHAVVPIVII